MQLSDCSWPLRWVFHREENLPVDLSGQGPLAVMSLAVNEYTGTLLCASLLGVEPEFPLCPPPSDCPEIRSLELPAEGQGLDYSSLKPCAALIFSLCGQPPLLSAFLSWPFGFNQDSNVECWLCESPAAYIFYPKNTEICFWNSNPWLAYLWFVNCLP